MIRPLEGLAAAASAYGVALLAVLGATALRWLLFSELGMAAPLTIYCAAVMIAAWHGGWGPGLFATAISLLIGLAFFPARALYASLDDALAIWSVVFVGACVLIIGLNDATRRARRRAEEENAARRRSAAALAESERRFRLMADTAHALAQARLDLDRVARAVVQRVAESLGDLCVLRVLTADGSQLEPVGYHHREARACDRLVGALGPVSSTAGILGQAAQSRQVQWRPRISPAEMMREAPGRDDLRAYLDQEGVSSLIVAPLLSGGRVLGTLALLRGRDGPEYTAEDRDLATALASRAAAAVENTRLLSDEQAARAEAETASRLKDEFLATLSHELRTPLNAIVGWTELLRGGELDPATMARALETIARNARIQTELVNDVLDVSRIISGNFRIQLAPVSLPAVVEAALETVRPSAQAKHIQLDAGIDPQLFSVAGDPARLQQVVWNLLANAVKFTPAGGRVEVRLANGHTHVNLRVIDTGAGIEAPFLPHVFERFRQGDASTTRAHGGLGLGLAIVRHIVEMHGGTVEARSDGRGRGATFVVKLPAAAMTPTTCALPPAAATAAGTTPASLAPVLGRPEPVRR